MINGSVGRNELHIGYKFVYSKLCDIILVDGQQDYTSSLSQIVNDGQGGGASGLVQLFLRVLKSDGTSVNVDLTSNVSSIFPNTGNNILAQQKEILDTFKASADIAKIWFDKALCPPNYLSVFPVLPNIDFDITLTTIVDATMVSAQLFAIVHTSFNTDFSLNVNLVEPSLPYRFK